MSSVSVHRVRVRLVLLLAAVAAVVVWLVFFDGSPRGVVAAPRLAVDSYALPTNFSAGGTGAYQVTVRNAGSLPTDGSDIVLADVLPPGLTAEGVEFYWSGAPGANLGGALCTTSPVECRYPGAARGFLPDTLGPDETLKMIVLVAVDAKASGALVNDASVTGGGVPAVTTMTRNAVSSVAAPFGPASFSFAIDGVDGAPERQAGGHPYEVTATFALNNSVRAHGGPEGESEDSSVQDLKDVVVQLPLGVVASTLAAPECPLSELSSTSRCPADTIVGHIATEPIGIAPVDSPIYNLVPERGVPGEFGFYDALSGTHVLYAHVVPTSSGYVLEAVNPDIPAVGLTRVTATFYGDPAAKQTELAEKEAEKEGKTATASSLPPVPYFTNPTNCSGQPLVATIYMDSWQNPAQMGAEGTPVNLEEPQWAKAQSQPSESSPVIGCNSLQFPAEIGAQPTTHESDKPSGLNFEIKIPQTEKFGTAVTSTMKNAVVTLPEGFTVDPSAGQGLAACSEAQIGWEEDLPGPVKFNAAPPACPESSKIGSLELETPLIPRKLEGEMFIASQNENPFHSTLASYVVVHDPITGVVLKIAGEVQANKQTGQLTARFDENPNLPFSDLKLHFFGGPRAEFATPETCGTFTTTTELTPWSASDSGPPPATPSDSFIIDEGCPGGFSPEFTALSSNVQAGAYTPFEASLARSDTDQELAGLSFTLPKGLLGKIAGVPLCGEAEIHAAEAATGGCPEGSQVGIVETAAGPGPNPLTVGGKAYLTGPYNGGPYGLAVVVPAVAGPFDFGTIVVRQSIRIDPRTAQVSDVSDPFPTIIDGIPVRLRRVNVILNRPQFMFNPTNCEPESFAGSILGSPLGAPRNINAHTVGYAAQTGSTASFTAPFKVTDCAGLKFTPHFEASTKAASSRLNGASLTVKVSYPNAAWGSQANLARVKVSLPKQLPSRLKTLQKACTAAQFNANPAGCPAASIVGHAVVHTPVLPTPLQGPAYFVSNGGQAFPNLIMVLQGDNVTVQLVGNTFISKKGITSSTFNSTPDVPFSSFQVMLPQGPYSALAGDLPSRAKGRFCGQKLEMPLVLDAQNGMTIEKTVKMSITGCGKKTHKASHSHTAKHRGRRG